MVELIKCKCGKRFPVNKWKHPNRRIVFCPFCRQVYENKWYDPTWRPNEKYWKGRTKSRTFTLADMRRILSGMYRRGMK